jgi:hypothetical protein
MFHFQETGAEDYGIATLTSNDRPDLDKDHMIHLFQNNVQDITLNT